MAPLDSTYWAPTPVTAYIPHPIEINEEDFPEKQFVQCYNISDTYNDNESFFGYASYDDYINCYVWPEYMSFNMFNYLDEILIPEGENIFGNLFGDPILDMEDFILALPIPEDENIFGNLFGDYIFSDGWDNDWEIDIELELNSHGFYGFLFGYGFITSQEEHDAVFGLYPSNIMTI